MKTIKWVGLTAIWGCCATAAWAQGAGAPVPANTGAPPAIAVAPLAAPPPVPVTLSSNAAEVVRLAESGVSEDVIVAYVQNSQATYQLSADDVLYLKDVGLPSSVVAAMLTRDNTLRNQAPSTPAPTPPPPAIAPPEPAPTAPAVEAAAPTYVSNPPAEVNYFYNDLTPYGTWVVLDGYGWCWQPRAVAIRHGWRPYCDGGHWVFSDCGWYWQSDYSWGWAPFHYGRWYKHDRCGWVWTPDRVWSPAWVTWRVGGSSCGWAPLPPHSAWSVAGGWSYNGASVGVGFEFGLKADHYTFVATKDVTQRDLGRLQFQPTQTRAVFRETTVVNNYTISQNSIVNHGIPVERVAAATHTEVRRATVRDLPRNAPRSSIAPRTELVVYRPELRAPVKSAPMVAQRVNDQHPVIRTAPITPAKIERTPSNGRAWPNPGAQNLPGTSNPWQTTGRGQSLVQQGTSTPLGSPGQVDPSSKGNKIASDWPPASRDVTQPAAQAGTRKDTPQASPPGVYYPKTYRQNFEGRQMARPAPQANATQNSGVATSGNASGNAARIVTTGNASSGASTGAKRPQ